MKKGNFNNGKNWQTNQSEYNPYSHTGEPAVDVQSGYYLEDDCEVIANGNVPSTPGYEIIVRFKNLGYDRFIEHFQSKPSVGTDYCKGTYLKADASAGHIHTEVGTHNGSSNLDNSLVYDGNTYDIAGFSKVKHAERCYASGVETVANFEGTTALDLPKSAGEISYDVWGLKNQYGNWVYVYAQKYEDNEIVVNKFDTADSLDDANVRYCPILLEENDFQWIVCRENTMFYHDKELTQAWYNEDGTTKTILKGQVLIAKSYGRIYR